MSNNKQSSVEWFIDKLEECSWDNASIRVVNISIDVSEYMELKKQAKSMHKEEHENTWVDSKIEDKGDNYIGKQKSFNEYYNETYGNNEQQ